MMPADEPDHGGAARVHRLTPAAVTVVVGLLAPATGAGRLAGGGRPLLSRR